MREIKFRAWCNGEMITPAVWVSDENLPCYSLGSSPKTPLMQYTGLKDANGVEIYEGDIVGPCSNGWNWVIEWGSFGDTGFYGSNQINSCRRLEPAPYSNDGAIIEITEDDVLQCVVIGNIHENPELLS